MSEAEKMRAMEVQEIMTREPTTATATQGILELSHLLEQAPYNHIPVVENRQLIGILSDRDIAKCFSPFFDHNATIEKVLLKTTAAELMSTPVITVDRTTSINCASILLLENNISCLPVVDDEDVLEGILTWKDILRFHVYY